MAEIVTTDINTAMDRMLRAGQVLRGAITGSRVRRPMSSIARNAMFEEHASVFAPVVVERATGGGERAYDIYSRLLKDRIVCLHSPVTPAAASAIVAQLLFLEGQSAEKPVYLYINSPGGSVSDGLAIYDTMQYVRCPVHTVCMGMAASMGAVLLAAGAKGSRFVLPNARLMLHQPLGGASGQASDIAIAAEEILKTRRRLNEIVARHTGQPVERIERVVERDYFMTSEEAVAFGLVDAVISKRESVPTAEAA